MTVVGCGPSTPSQQTQGCTGACPVDGECGSADGAAVASAPATGLCQVGTASNVSGTGPWSWTCVGSDGGSDASCSAPLGTADGVVNLSSASFRIGENAGYIGFTVRSTSSHLASVKVATADGSAHASTDYQAISSTVSVDLEQQLSVSILDNAVTDGDRTFHIVLSDPSSNVTLGDVTTATVTIVDDDPPPAGMLEFNSTWFDRSTPVRDGAYAGQVTIPVSRRGAGVGAVSIHYATVDGGTATAGDDYEAVSGTLSWADGDTSDKTFVIPVVRDVEYEEHDTIRVALDTPTGGAALGIRSPVDVLLFETFDRDTGPVLDVSSSSSAFDSEGVSGPAVVQLASDSFVMFYTGTESSSALIGRAVSSDGVTWTKSPATAVTSFAAAEPAVVYDGSSWHMWYSPAWDLSAIYYATSADGLSWSVQNSGDPVLQQGDTLDWDGDGIGCPTVIYEGGSFTMWYTGAALEGARSIGRATSSDGVSWTKDAANPLVQGEAGTWDDQGVRDPSVLHDGSTYWMLYTGVSSYWRLGIAMSSDGITWTKYPNPLMGLYSGAWDDEGYGGPSALLVGETMMVWYTGYGLGATGIGRATNGQSL